MLAPLKQATTKKSQNLPKKLKTCSQTKNLQINLKLANSVRSAKLGYKKRSENLKLTVFGKKKKYIYIYIKQKM